MGISFLLFFGIFFTVFGFINYYIGWRTWQYLGKHLSYLNVWIYWMVFWILALTYVAARGLARFLPDEAIRILNLIGSYWIAVMLYATLAYIILDSSMVAVKRLKLFPLTISQTPVIYPVSGAFVVLLVIGTLIYGTWNAQHPIVTHYNMDILKKAGSMKQLHLVMVSDLHLGILVRNNRLEKMVHEINALNPDLILLAGDIIDEDIIPYEKQNMAETMRGLKAGLGVYGILGNHEYFGHNLDRTVQDLENSGIQMLRDEYIKVNGSFYLAGRVDRSAERYFGRPRLKLDELLKGVDKSLPVILADHQPFQLEEPEAEGVDLQLSGHTHRGQLFPNQFITQRIYEIDWGYKKKGNLNVVVSSGYGTWGPPIRTGNHPEIVDITVNFRK